MTSLLNTDTDETLKVVQLSLGEVVNAVTRKK